MRANFSAEYFAFFTIFAQNPVACAELPHSCLPLDSSAFQPITPRFPSMQKRSPPHTPSSKETTKFYWRSALPTPTSLACGNLQAAKSRREKPSPRRLSASCAKSWVLKRGLRNTWQATSARSRSA